MRTRWFAIGSGLALVAAVAGAYALSRGDGRAPTRPVAAGETLDGDTARHYGPAIPAAAEQAPLTPGETRYAKAGARLLPARAVDRATIASSQALDVLRRSGLRSDVFTDGGTPTFDLVRYTNDHVGKPDPSTGALIPSFRDRLVWVVTFPEAYVVVRGGRGHAPVDGGRCPFVYIVDATSGAPLDAFQECAPLRG
jgi:hypothetical protein